MKNIPEKIDAHTHIPSEKLILKPPFPDAIKIEITSRCNYNCNFCAVKTSKRPKGDINKEFLYRILHEAKNIGVKEIGMFLLGESMLVKELAEYIQYAKQEAGIDYVFLTTNGYLCSIDRLKPLVEAGLDSLKFSINAPTDEQYKIMHGIDGFRKVVANIRHFYEWRQKNNITSIRTCVSSICGATEHHDQQLFREMISKYVDDFYYLPMYNQAGHVTGQVFGNPGRLDNMVDAVPCWALFNAAKITWDGWLTACCFDHDERFEIADLNKTSLLEAWHHPKFIELRKAHLENNVKKSLCAKCLGY